MQIPEPMEIKIYAGSFFKNFLNNWKIKLHLSYKIVTCVFLLSLTPPWRIYKARVTSLTCKANVQSTKTSLTWNDFVNTNSKRKVRFYWDFADKSPCWQRDLNLWPSIPSLPLAASSSLPMTSLMCISLETFLELLKMKLINCQEFFGSTFKGNP